VSAADFAATHAAAFGEAGWPESDFARYLGDAKIYVAGDAPCFAVFRVLGPEAEVLTLATHPDVQGKGRATAMLRAALDHLRANGVQEVFLDVSEDNTAALALYARCGFAPFATRTAYYSEGAAAICMKVRLSPRD
jgi:ribosomal-protein-alanine N-acetyltransferase